MDKITPLDSRFEPLGLALFSAVMQVTKKVVEGLNKLSREREISQTSNWAIRIEELAFFLHLASRLAFIAGGDELRARLQDYLAVRLVNNLVDYSFDTSNVDPQCKREISGKMKMEVLDFVNDAEMEFASCKTWLKMPQLLDLGKSNRVFVPGDNDVIGILAKRIAKDIGQNDTGHFRQLIWGMNIEACNDFQIIGQIDLAIKSLKN